MSFLQNNNPEQPAPAVFAADRIKTSGRVLYQQMRQLFVTGAKTFWSNNQASPAEIAEALGPDATQVFQLHYKIGQLLAEIDPGVLQEVAGVIGQFEYNEDGTVTIIEEESAE